MGARTDSATTDLDQAAPPTDPAPAPLQRLFKPPVFFLPALFLSPPSLTRHLHPFYTLDLYLNMRLAIPLASTLFATAPAYAAYNLLRDYSGANFFTGWDFYGNYDNLTNGACFFCRYSCAPWVRAESSMAGCALFVGGNLDFCHKGRR